jgi:hypothetical protein
VIFGQKNRGSQCQNEAWAESLDWSWRMSTGFPSQPVHQCYVLLGQWSCHHSPAVRSFCAFVTIALQRIQNTSWPLGTPFMSARSRISVGPDAAPTQSLWFSVATNKHFGGFKFQLKGPDALPLGKAITETAVINPLSAAHLFEDKLSCNRSNWN